MDIRYSTGPQDVKRYTTEELRKEFLIENLYQPDRVTATYSHVDRMVVLGIMPVEQALPIDQGIDVWANFGTRYFLERREAGVFNLGGPGAVEADGETYSLDFQDCLYITKETKDVVFSSRDPRNPARFYLVSFFGGFTVPAYAASKGGVAQLTKALSNEWAGRNIQVNAIAPGYMATEMNTALMGDEGRSTEILGRIPARRWGTPEDMKGIAVFLASPASDYVNGAIIPVDGGYLAK